MTRLRFLHAVALVPLLLLVDVSSSLSAEQETSDWLRSSGKETEIRLRGEVFEAEGRPTTDLKITGSLKVFGVVNPLEPKVEGHRFEVWVPVHRLRGLWFRAASANGDRVAYKQLSAFEIRQAAIDGIKLTLQEPTREVEVRVVHEGQPISGAAVKVELGAFAFQIELRSHTDDDGIARFRLLSGQKLHRLDAWTEDFRIGGYSFRRKPARDPNVDRHVIELSKCRDQKMRFVDGEGAPVSGLDFVISMATAAPNYNFLGTNEHFTMTTGSAGEANYKWFPDWDDHHFSAHLRSDQWKIDGDKEIEAGVVVFKLKRAKNRKRIEGRVVSDSGGVSGLYVEMSSFQGEQENQSDVPSTFTASDGTFSVDVLPDSTYCAYVLDTQWVSEIVDMIPYQSKSGKITPPVLSVSKGQEVEVIVTSGPQEKPYSNLPIYINRIHHFTWQGKERTQNGSTGPRWWATTDKSGRATALTLPGELKAMVLSPQWRAEETVHVKDGEVTTIRFHREVEEKRKVSGRLVLPEGFESTLERAEIKIGSVGGNYDDQQTLTCGKDGSFSFETLSAEIGVFGSTHDGRAAGSVVATNLDAPITVLLRPTRECDGQLLGKGDQPLVGHGVRAIIRVAGDEDSNGGFLTHFEAKRIEAKTDEQGNFTLHGVPIEMQVDVYTDAMDGSPDRTRIGEIYLELNDSRPRTVIRLSRALKNDSEQPLALQYTEMLRDCALSGFHLMVITSSNTKSVTEFVDKNFKDHRANKNISRFMQIVVSDGEENLASADVTFLKEHDWQLAGEDRVIAYAVDAKGNKLGRLEIDVSDEGAAEEVADFIHQNAPVQVDAEKKWKEAFAEASRSNRRVWARTSSRYCGPCFRMARWLDDQQKLLEEDYVMLKIDRFRDQSGDSVADRLTGGMSHGVPFHAIFDHEENLLIDSVGLLGNIGHPSSYEGKKHLQKMLLETRQKLTDDEIDQLVESLED